MDGKKKGDFNDRPTKRGEPATARQPIHEMLSCKGTFTESIRRNLKRSLRAWPRLVGRSDDNMNVQLSRSPPLPPIALIFGSPIALISTWRGRGRLSSETRPNILAVHTYAANAVADVSPRRNVG